MKVTCRYELSKVIEELKVLRADIIGLQEVDIACERSNNVDTGTYASLFSTCLQAPKGRPSQYTSRWQLADCEAKRQELSISGACLARCLSCVALHAGETIAEALGMNYTFLCEFEELHSPVRDARSQAGIPSHVSKPSVLTVRPDLF